jgi:hypothetical protein
VAQRFAGSSFSRILNVRYLCGPQIIILIKNPLSILQLYEIPFYMFDQISL